MSFSLFISVLIGLVFTWFLLSLAILNIQEWIASRGKWRSKMLEKAIEKMLADSIYKRLFYNHPLILSLFTGKDNKDKPSYIPAGQFSQVVLDILATSGTEASLLEYQLYKLQTRVKSLARKNRKAASHRINLLLGMTRKALVSEGGEEAVASIVESAKNDLLNLQTRIHKLQEPIDQAFTTIRDQKVEINDALVKLAYQQQPSSNDTVNQIRAGIIGLSVIQPVLKQTLYPLMQTASLSVWQKENELELIRKNIEEWFNNSMTRLTGAYKRRTMISAFFIGLFLAVLINVDSINIADRIWHEPELRTLILDKVNNVIGQVQVEDAESLEWVSVQEQANLSGLPIGWVGNLSAFEEVVPTYNMALEARNCTLFPTRQGHVYGFWVKANCYQLINAPRLTDAAGWLVKIAGLFITAIAASQGAPIWFDILKKIVNIRLTGLSPAESKKAFG